MAVAIAVGVEKVGDLMKSWNIADEILVADHGGALLARDHRRR